MYRPRLIIAQTNPPLALPILAITKKLFSIPYIVICMDLYPNVLISSIKNKLITLCIVPLLTFLFRIVYNSSSAVVTNADRSMSTALT